NFSIPPVAVFHCALFVWLASSRSAIFSASVLGASACTRAGSPRLAPGATTEAGRAARQLRRGGHRNQSRQIAKLARASVYLEVAIDAAILSSIDIISNSEWAFENYVQPISRARAVTRRAQCLR